MLLVTAFISGLLGSLHCVGMCGPIAMALPFRSENKGKMLIRMLAYNGGRLVTYILIGTLIGLLGKGLFLVQFQKQLTIGLAIFLLAISIFSIPVENRMMQLSGVNTFYFWLRKSLARLFTKRQQFQFFKIGLVNGFLPCGLVYLAIVGALAMGSVGGGILFMLLFGLGTFPLMLLTIWLGQSIKPARLSQLRKLYPVYIFAVGLLILWRGLQFNSPTSFELWETMQYIPMCH